MPRVPRATYRVQLQEGFGFEAAAGILDYLDAIGISDLYVSPIGAARQGSTHGYDVVDHERLSPALGGEVGLEALAERLAERRMGLVVDVVANHMCVAGGENRWWNDVLENGPSSPYAGFFDIDWAPPKSDLENKVLLPVLGDQYGRVLEDQGIRLEQDGGGVAVRCDALRLPIAPRTFARLLEPTLARARWTLPPEHAAIVELESILTAIGHLPPRTEREPEKLRERLREKEVIKRRLGALVDGEPAIAAALHATIAALNGRRGEPWSFDDLEALLAEQAYRLSHWRVAAHEINYRRFFDINDLAAIRVEEPAVFDAVHELLVRLVRRGWITGLRIDHVDGLYDPARYLDTLAAQTGRPYLVVEKILRRDERLPSWNVDGTTGYDFLDQVTGLFVDRRQGDAFRRLYERFTGRATPVDDLTYQCKALVLDVAMSGELTMLARSLDRISEQHRHTRDFTLYSLQAALREIIACFPAYRTYLGETGAPDPEDRRRILAAARSAKRRNPAISGSIYDFIAQVMLGDDPPGITAEQARERRVFALRVQQITGPIAAKGVEDTACYRYYPLAALVEVGGDLSSFGVTPGEFHRANLERRERWPRTMLATSTHDTKRSEDVRARLCALSEAPGTWYRAILRWHEVNRGLRSLVDGVPAPDRNEEYLLYQTLVGIWPFGATGPAELIPRIEEYMVKALREAKVHSSWVNPNEAHEQAVCRFVRAILTPGPDNRFLRSFLKLQSRVARVGALTSLAQTLLKIASPGVPDFYQGAELWSLALVDPDNRRAVDYARRRELLEAIRAHEPTTRAARLLRRYDDGAIKLHVISSALALRRRHPDLFLHGSYVPLAPAGPRADHLLAFARVHAGRTAIAATGRLFLTLGAATSWPVGPATWTTTTLPIPEDLAARRWRDALTGSVLAGGPSLPLSELFSELPLALLESLAE